MIPAAKHFDPILGIDVHIIQPPGPVPPLPIPHPHIGMVLDPMDYVPFIGSTVTIFGMNRAQAGTACTMIPPSHIPMGGVFVKPPGNESEVFMGSSTVAIDGDAGSFLGVPVLSCQDIGIPAPPRPGKAKKTKQLVLPTTVLLAIPVPVLVGGPPTVSLMALGMRVAMPHVMRALGAGARAAGRALRSAAGAASDAMGSLARRGRRASRATRSMDNGVRCNGLHPVNLITGEQFDQFLDAKAPPSGLFEWRRYYTTARRSRDAGLGFGFSHRYDEVLLREPQAWRFVDWTGREIAFRPLVGDLREDRCQGYRLERVGDRRYRLTRADEPERIFAASEENGVGLLVQLVRGPRKGVGGASLELAYDRAGRLVGLREERDDADRARYVLYRDDRDRIVEVRVTDARGERSLGRYGYDSTGCLTASQNAAGGEHRYSYDGRRLMTGMRDPRGYSFWWRYDDAGRCVEGAGEDGLWWGRIEYDPEKLETRTTSRNGSTYVYRYDGNGTLREMIDPYGGVLVREVDDEDGRVLKETDAGGRTLRWLYDDDGVHTGRVDDLGYVYPPEVEMPVRPDPLAPTWPTTPKEWLVGDVTAEAAVGRGDVDVLPGAMRSAIDALALPPEVSAATKIYDDLGRVVDEHDRCGRRVRHMYDPCGNEVATADADGRVFETPQTRWNLLGAQVDPLGNRTEYAYTSTEQVSRVVDPGGTSSEYGYDEKDRLVEVRRHGAQRETYVYDAGDRLLAKHAADGRRLLSFEYDERALATRLILGSEDAPEGEVRFAYDGAGRVVEASTEAHEVQIRRDARGRVREDRVDGVGLERLRGGTATFERWFGRFESVRRRDGATGDVWLTDPTGGRHRLRVVSSGLVVREHANGTVEAARYDEDGRLWGQLRHKVAQDGASHLHARRYTYTPAGDLVSVVDTEQGRTEHVTDAAHRLSETRYPDGRVVRYVRDAAGNLVEKPGLSAVALAGNRLRHANGNRYAYDDRQHLSEVERPDGSRTRYVYDPLDMLVRVEDVDAAGEPTRAAWTASYDGLGRRLASGRGEARWRFHWDGERLGAEVSPDGRVRVYVYPSEEARVPWLFVDYASVDAAPESGRVYAVFTDQAGMPTHVEDATGRLVWSATPVDAYGGLRVDASSELEFHLRWPGHRYDPDTGLHDNRYRAYDPALGRYLQTDPLGVAGGTNTYAYAPNPLVQVDVLGLAHDGVTPPTHANGTPRPATEVTLDNGLRRLDDVAPPGSRLSDGTPMPDGTRRIDYVDEDGVLQGRHYVDADGRTIRSEVRVNSPATRTKASSRPTPEGMASGDHRGHLAPERHTADQRAANVPENLVPEHASSNLSPKKRWENQVPDWADEHPDSDVFSVHEPHYSGDSPRPDSISHGIEVDGVRRQECNSGPIPNDSSARDYPLPFE